MISVDTNVILAFCSISGVSEVAENLYIKDSEWHAPLLWISEFRNILMFYHRQRLISLQVCEEALELAHGIMPAGRTHLVEDRHVVDLAVRSGCSGYDCEYVAIAEILDVRLLTWDKQILRQFPKKAITPEDFLKL